MFPEPSILFREFAMDERLPLATIHAAVLEYIKGRLDVAVFGAQAVNTYVDTPRMTQDVDLLCTCAEFFAEELREHLNQKFHVAVRVRCVANGAGYRIYQVATPRNRHLVGIRQVTAIPACRTVQQVSVVAPPELLAMKVVSMTARPGTPKGLTDEADILRMLLVFPEHKIADGAVANALSLLNADEQAIKVWLEFVVRDIQPETDDEY